MLLLVVPIKKRPQFFFCCVTRPLDVCAPESLVRGKLAEFTAMRRQEVPVGKGRADTEDADEEDGGGRAESEGGGWGRGGDEDEDDEGGSADGEGEGERPGLTG